MPATHGAAQFRSPASITHPSGCSFLYGPAAANEPSPRCAPGLVRAVPGTRLRLPQFVNLALDDIHHAGGDITAVANRIGGVDHRRPVDQWEPLFPIHRGESNDAVRRLACGDKRIACDQQRRGDPTGTSSPLACERLKDSACIALRISAANAPCRFEVSPRSSPQAFPQPYWPHGCIPLLRVRFRRGLDGIK